MTWARVGLSRGFGDSIHWRRSPPSSERRTIIKAWPQSQVQVRNINSKWNTAQIDTNGKRTFPCLQLVHQSPLADDFESLIFSRRCVIRRKPGYHYIQYHSLEENAKLGHDKPSHAIVTLNWRNSTYCRPQIHCKSIKIFKYNLYILYRAQIKVNIVN